MRIEQKNALVTVQQMLEKSRPTIQMALPDHLKLDRVIRIALTEIRTNPGLLNCSPESVVAGIVKSSQLGLEVGAALGQAYLVPFGREATLIIGYRGLIALARRSGEIVSITARCVFEGDHFELEYGLDEKLSHRPCADPGEMTHAYAIAKLTGGGIQYDVMLRGEIDAIRARSRAGNSGPWVTDYHEMARKTVVRRLAKYLPISIEMAEAISADSDQVPDLEIVDVSSASADVMDRARALESETQTSEMTAEPEADEDEDWPQKRNGVLVDVRGVPWHADLYSAKKTCTDAGMWRKRRGAKQEDVDRHEARFLAKQESGGTDTVQDEHRTVQRDLTEDELRKRIDGATSTDELSKLLDLVDKQEHWDPVVRNDLQELCRNHYADWQLVEEHEASAR